MEVPRPSNFHYKRTIHSLIRPRIKYGAGSSGTFSRREKESITSP